MNVIVLEDDGTQRQQIKNLLETAEVDFTVFAFKTYNEAWDQFKKLREENKKLDLLIVDIRLDFEGKPEGGLEFAANVQKQRPVATVILSDHFNEPEYEQKVKKFDLSTRFYFPKTFLSTEGMLLEHIWGAIFDFQRREWTAAEYLLQTSRRIGLLDNHGKYRFIGKDDISYLAADGKATAIYLSNKQKVVVTSNIGNIGQLVKYNYPNICQMGQGHWVNLEKVVAFDMSNHEDLQKNPELELEGGYKIKLPIKDFQILFSEGLLIQPKTKK